MLKEGMDGAWASGARRRARASATRGRAERVWRPAAGVDACPTGWLVAGGWWLCLAGETACQTTQPQAESVSECIPESGAKIVESGAIGIACDGVVAVQVVDRQVQGAGHGGDAEAHAGSGFEEVGPGLAFLIHGEVDVPVELRLQCAQRGRVAEAILRVEQEIVIEAAHENGVVIGFEEEAAGFGFQHVAEALGERGTAAVVRHYVMRQISDGGAGFGPAHQPVPNRGGHTEAGNEGAFGQILRRNAVAFRSDGPARVADRSEEHTSE